MILTKIKGKYFIKTLLNMHIKGKLETSVSKIKHKNNKIIKKGVKQHALTSRCKQSTKEKGMTSAVKG